MANTLTNIIPTILARGLMALRSRTVLPRLVNRDYETEAREQGDTVTIPVPTAVTTAAVTSAEVPSAPANTTPGKVSLTLDNWRKSTPFHLSDKDFQNIIANESFIPGQLSAAIEALASYVNTQIFALYTGVYGYAGTAGVTPFDETTPVVDVATEAMTVLNTQKCPQDNRRAVLDWIAHGKAAALPAFSNADKKGSDGTLMSGELGRVFGFDWFGDGDVPYHTNSYAGTPLVDDAAGVAAGLKVVHMDGFTTKPEAGDIFTIPARSTAGVLDDTQTYVVTSSTTLVGTDSDVSFEPGLKIALAAGDDSTPVLFKASHRANLAFHRDAIAFASRPLVDSDMALGGSEIQSMTDPVTGLSLRLEVTRQYKQTAWEFDILFGTVLVRAELACVIAG
jgi:hypothetical protein